MRISIRFSLSREIFHPPTDRCPWTSTKSEILSDVRWCVSLFPDYCGATETSVRTLKQKERYKIENKNSRVFHLRTLAKFTKRMNVDCIKMT